MGGIETVKRKHFPKDLSRIKVIVGQPVNTLTVVHW